MLLFFCAAAGYLLGSLSFSIILSKLKGRDVRCYGSRNAGATNCARLYGIRTGFAVLSADMLKTFAAAAAGWYIAGQSGMLAACIGCLAGHIFPCWFGFRGGKGVSVIAAVAVILNAPVFLASIALFMLIFALDRRVSLCSMAAAVSFPVFWIISGGPADSCFTFACLLPLTVLLTHRENIRRIIAGTEPVFRPAGKHK